MKKFGILNGPNLNRLGTREPDIYGLRSLADLEILLTEEAEALEVELEFFQSNLEGSLIDKIAEWADNDFSGVVFNPAAYTHTSVALRDAVAASSLPFVEVHISNVYTRESFRHHSYTAPVSVGIISGLGFFGYLAGLRYLADR